MAARFYPAQSTILSSTGKIESGAKIFTYVNGAAPTLKTTWTDEALTVPHTNPIISDGTWPTIFANDSDVFSIEIKDADDNIIQATIDDYSGVSEFALSSADVLAALAANSADVVINGTSMAGSAFANFADAFILTAAGTIDASLGAITLGEITGDVEATGDLKLTTTGSEIAFFSGVNEVILTHSATAGGTLTMTSGIVLNVPLLEATSEIRSTGPVSVGPNVGGTLGIVRGGITANDGTLLIAPGGTVSAGAGLLLYDENHATQADDFEFTGGSGSTVIFGWDASANLFSFTAGDLAITNNNLIFGDGSVADAGLIKINSNSTDGTLTLTGATLVSDGASLKLHGNTHATKAGDFDFTGGSGSTVLGWDSSAGSLTLTDGTFVINSSTPEMIWEESDATADNGRWDIRAASENFELRAVNDANTVANAFLTVTRTGTTIDSLTTPSGAEVFLNLPTSAGTTGSLFSNSGIVTVS